MLGGLTRVFRVCSKLFFLYVFSRSLSRVCQGVMWWRLMCSIVGAESYDLCGVGSVGYEEGSIKGIGRSE